MRQAIVEANRIIAFSQFSRNLIVKGLGEEFAEKVKVIPPGLESSWLEVERNQVVSNRILFWGRIEEEKGLPELFFALKTVAKKFTDVKLTLVGEGKRLQEYKSPDSTPLLADRSWPAVSYGSTVRFWNGQRFRVQQACSVIER